MSIQLNTDCKNQILQFAIKQQFELLFIDRGGYDNQIGLKYYYGSIEVLVIFKTPEIDIRDNIEQIILTATTNVKINIGDINDYIHYLNKDKKFYQSCQNGYVALPTFLNNIIITILKHFTQDYNATFDYQHQVNTYHQTQMKAFKDKMVANGITVIDGFNDIDKKPML